MVSALKIGGGGLHELAPRRRSGTAGAHPSRSIVTELESFKPGRTACHVVVDCGMRHLRTVLAADLGVALGGVRTSNPCDGCGSVPSRLDERIRRNDRGAHDRLVVPPAERCAAWRGSMSTRSRAAWRTAQPFRRRACRPDAATARLPSSTRGDLLAVYERRGAGVKTLSRAPPPRAVDMISLATQRRDRRPNGRVVTIGASTRAPRSSACFAWCANSAMRVACVGRRHLRRHPPKWSAPISAPKFAHEPRPELGAALAMGNRRRLPVITFDEARSKRRGGVRRGVAGSALRTRSCVGADFHFAIAVRRDVPGQRMGADSASSVGVSAWSLRRRHRRFGRGHAVFVDRGAPCSPKATSGARFPFSAAHEVRGVVERRRPAGRNLASQPPTFRVPDRICLPADGVYAAPT